MKQSAELIRIVREVIIKTIKNELDEFADKYDIPVEEIEKLAVSLYVKDTSKTQWKSSNTKFVKLFKKEIEMLYDNQIINCNELGFMTMLSIKFGNFEDIALRNNNGSYCTQKDIIKESGLSKSTVSKMLKGLIHKKIIFERKHDSILNAKCYSISPYLLYQGKNIDSKFKVKLKEMHHVFMDTWKNNTPDIDVPIIDLSEFAPEEFIAQLEEEIVDQYLQQTYS
jgi:DNA-binding MarR family transcriptional regulator